MCSRDGPILFIIELQRMRDSDRMSEASFTGVWMKSGRPQRIPGERTDSWRVKAGMVGTSRECNPGCIRSAALPHHTIERQLEV